MPAVIRRVIVALTLLSVLAPAMSRTANANDAIELYRSDEFDYFFFYDASAWEIVDQEAEPGSDFVRFSDGDIWVTYWAFDAQGMTAGACVNQVLDTFSNDPSILEYEAFTAAGGPAEVRDAGNFAEVSLVMTIDGSDGRFKLATNERCDELTPGQSLLYTSVNLPSASSNAGRRFEVPWLRGYLPSYELNSESAPVPVQTPDGDIRGSLMATPNCPSGGFHVIAQSLGGGGNFVIDSAAFFVEYSAGNSIPVPVVWLAPNVPPASSLALQLGEVGLFSLEIPETDYELYYVSPEGSPLVLSERRGRCPVPDAGTSPYIADMDE